MRKLTGSDQLKTYGSKDIRLYLNGRTGSGNGHRQYSQEARARNRKEKTGFLKPTKGSFKSYARYGKSHDLDSCMEYLQKEASGKKAKDVEREEVKLLLLSTDTASHLASHTARTCKSPRKCNQAEIIQ